VLIHPRNHKSWQMIFQIIIGGIMKLCHYVVTACIFLLFAPSNTVSQTATAPSVGDGSVGNPYQISTLDNLYWITQNNSEWNKYYLQSQNIDASSTSSWHSGSGFSPIGNGSISFTGNYDGGDYTISNLYINRSSTDYVSLFGFISNGTVKKVNLTSINITGQDYTSGLVGFSTGGSSIIENSSASGSVTGRTNVGGLIGSTAAGTTVSGCNADVTVTSNNSGNNLGGFIGRHTQGSSISNSYSRGNVTSADGDHTGGFAGNVSFVSPSSPTITNCYSTGNAYSYNRAGGFIGSVLSATVSNCYSIGSATLNGGSTSGGFIALNSSGTVSNSFWDTQASGNASSAAGTGKTTTQMKTQSTFTDAGWDFDAVWELIGGNYPRLQNNSDPALPVELISFTAISTGQSVELKWSTATEMNNYGFEVERKGLVHRSTGSFSQSADEPMNQWLGIKFVEGSGTTNAPKEYSFTDKNLSAGKYSYRLKQIDRDGKFSYSQAVEVTVGIVPHVFALEQNYPNPFNPGTTIGFTLQTTGMTTLKIYDAIGREVATLVNENLDAGVYHQKTFDASKLSSGIYIAKLSSNGNNQIRKLTVIK
jgi:hypothetical protein